MGGAETRWGGAGWGRAPVAPPNSAGNLGSLRREPGAPPTTRKKALAPGADKPAEIKKAVKCDMCRDLKGGPACVRACPTGAALRISPEKFLDYAGGGG